MKSFEKISYKIEIDESRKVASHSDIESMVKNAATLNSIRRWRSKRYFDLLRGIVEIYPTSTWLTVGDGMGMDAHMLSEIMPNGCVCASDIDDSILNVSKRLGFVRNISAENAESLSFGDETFDFVLCKHAFHHFPRPYMALYEMIRVACNGVVLIEPYDQYLTQTHRPFGSLAKGLYLSLKHIAKYLLGKPLPIYEYESSNFVYSVNERELAKVVTSMYFSALAYRGINDHCVSSSEERSASFEDMAFVRIWLKNKLFDVFSFLKLKESTTLISVILKMPLAAELEHSLKRSGYRIFKPPVNRNYQFESALHNNIA